MKVLFVMHNNFLYSGATLAMLEVIEQLNKIYGIEVEVLFPKDGGTANQYCSENEIPYYVANYYVQMFSETDSCIKNCLKLPLLYIRELKMKKSCKALKNIMRNIDLVYSNSCTTLFGLLLSKMYSIPHIWHIREFGDLDHRLIYPFGKKRYFALANKIDSEIVLISKCLYESRREYFQKEKMHLIYDDVNRKYNNPTEKSEKEKLNILIAGDIKAGKGQMIAIEALGLLKVMAVNDFELFIVGKVGDQKYKDEMNELVEKYSIQDRIHYLGHVSDMNNIRMKMDIGIVASNSEAFGRVTVEGMLSKMAMVGRNSGATPEILQDGLTGLLYDGTAEDLKNKLILLRDRQFRINIAEKGYTKAVLSYVNGNCAKQVAELIYATAEKV